jgi:hypothetical protein
MTLKVVIEFSKAVANMMKHSKSRAVQKAIQKASTQGALLIQGRAQQRIMKGPKSGIVYGPQRLAAKKNRGLKLTKREAGKVHQASSPGEAPANWSGHLVRGIKIARAELTGFGVYTAKVISTAPYSCALEYGTRKAGKTHDVVILERPFMKPSVDESLKEIDTLIKVAVAAAMKEDDDG